MTTDTTPTKRPASPSLTDEEYQELFRKVSLYVAEGKVEIAAAVDEAFADISKERERAAQERIDAIKREL